MSIRISALALVVAILLLSFPAAAFAGPPNDHAPVSDFLPEQILVKFKPDVALPEAAQIHRQLGGQVKETIPGIGVQVVKVPKGQEKAKAKAYSANPRVEYAEPDFVAQALGTPNDPGFGNQWGMVKVQAPEAWDVTTGSPDVTIAILDTGVDLDHPDLASKIVANINFSSSPTVDDVDGHGTHVAGIAGALTNNGIGVAGLGYSAAIMNVKVLGDTGSGAYSAIASGITWATDNGAKIINMSLSGSSASSTLEAAVNYAWNKGVVVVAAAGNDGDSAPEYPAYYTNCIAVAATDLMDKLPSWSNRGDWVDLAAPGNSIYATLRDGTYGYKSGTSMASPHVAGLAALVFTVVTDSNGNGRLNDEVRSRIEGTCDDIGVAGIGAGRINAYRAVSNGASTPAPVPPPPTTGSISGKVMDAANGSPIAGATVGCNGVSVTSDSNGEFVITNLSQGVYTVAASASGYADASQTVEVLAGQTSVANFALVELPPPAPKKMWVESITFKVSGRNLNVMVKTVSDGQALAGASVGLTVTNGGQNWWFQGVTDASSSVTFTIAKAPAGTYEAKVSSLSAAGYEWDASLGVTSASYTLGSKRR
jgi:thermitase